MHLGEDRDQHGYYYQRTGALKDGTTSKLSQHIVNVLRLAVQLSLIMFKAPGTGLEKTCTVRDQPLGAAGGGKLPCG